MGRPTTGRNFSIKTDKPTKTKSIIFPSSINHIPLSTTNKKKSYKLKKPDNIFTSNLIKNKEDLYKDILEDKSRNIGSFTTISTAATVSKKSIFEDDSRYYHSDKTKKCVRALNNNIFGNIKEKNLGKYVANLSKNDIGKKKVRFIED